MALGPSSRQKIDQDKEEIYCNYDEQKPSAEVPKGHAYTSRDETALGRVSFLAHYYTVQIGLVQGRK